MPQAAQQYETVQPLPLAPAGGTPPDGNGHLIKKIGVSDMPTYSVGVLDGFDLKDGQLFKIVRLTEKQDSYKKYCGIQEGSLAVYRHCGLPHKDGVFAFIKEIGDAVPYTRICVRGFEGAYAIPVARS